MSVNTDRDQLRSWLEGEPPTASAATFVEGPGIARLQLSFDIEALRNACVELRAAIGAPVDATGHAADGFEVIGLTRRPGQATETEADQSGRYWRQLDANTEAAFEPIVDEAAYDELIPEARGTYFEHVHHSLAGLFVVGRMRLLTKAPYNCNSWHRDPEPRVHIPVVADPGSLFVVNHHCTHLPADGSVYFTDTRSYHTACNGGPAERIHIVAAIAGPGDTAPEPTAPEPTVVDPT